VIAQAPENVEDVDEAEDDEEDPPFMTALYGLGGALGGAAIIWYEGSDPTDEWVYFGIPAVWVAYVAIVVGVGMLGVGLYGIFRK